MVVGDREVEEEFAAVSVESKRRRRRRLEWRQVA
jgi:hypothetical protein